MRALCVSDVGWRRRKTQTILQHCEMGEKENITHITGGIADGCFRQRHRQTEAVMYVQPAMD